MKLFRTKDMSVVNYCQLIFKVDIPSDIQNPSKLRFLKTKFLALLQLPLGYTD